MRHEKTLARQIHEPTILPHPFPRPVAGLASEDWCNFLASECDTGVSSPPDIDLSCLPMLPPVLPGCTCATQGAENMPTTKAHKTKRCTTLSCRSLFSTRHRRAIGESDSVAVLRQRTFPMGPILPIHDKMAAAADPGADNSADMPGRTIGAQNNVSATVNRVVPAIGGPHAGNAPASGASGLVFP